MASLRTPAKESLCPQYPKRKKVRRQTLSQTFGQTAAAGLQFNAATAVTAQPYVAGQAIEFDGLSVVVQGTPEDVAANPHSHTGHFLKRLLDAHDASTTVAKPAKPAKKTKR